VTSLALNKRVRIAMVMAIAYAAGKYYSATLGREFNGEKEAGSLIDELPLWKSDFKVLGRRRNKKENSYDLEGAHASDRIGIRVSPTLQDFINNV